MPTPAAEISTGNTCRVLQSGLITIFCSDISFEFSAINKPSGTVGECGVNYEIAELPPQRRSNVLSTNIEHMRVWYPPSGPRLYYCESGSGIWMWIYMPRIQHVVHYPCSLKLLRGSMG